MQKFFDNIRSIIQDIAENDDEKKQILNEFFLRILTVFDGLEGLDLEWNGIALVARESLPNNVEEINDEFLHDAWSQYILNR